MPSEETMFYRNETQRVTIALMDSGEVSDRMKIVEKYDKNKLKSLQSSQLEHFLFHLEALREIPEEYRYIDPPETTPQTVEDMYNLRRDLGRTAINVTNLIRLSEIGQVAA